MPIRHTQLFHDHRIDNSYYDLGYYTATSSYAKFDITYYLYYMTYNLKYPLLLPLKHILFCCVISLLIYIWVLYPCLCKHFQEILS